VPEPEETRLCFVIMPFTDSGTVSGAEWTDFFENDLVPAVQDAGLGYRCRRSDGVRGNIVNDILRDLSDAHVVIADLTDRNPNVFYELAVRHTLSPRTILITRDLASVPFDLRPYGIYEYALDNTAGSHQRFVTGIRARLAEIAEQPEKPDSPVLDFLAARRTGVERLETTLQRRQLNAVTRETEWVAGGFEADVEYYQSKNLPLGSPLVFPALNHVLGTGVVGNDVFAENGLNLLHELGLDAAVRGKERAGELHTNRNIDYFDLRVVFTARAAIFTRWLGQQATYLADKLEQGIAPENVELTAFPIVLEDLLSDEEVIELIEDDLSDWVAPEFRV